MSAISKVSICNQALTYLGAKRITLLTEDSTNARTCNALYNETLEDILTETPWTFALKRTNLGTVDEDPAFTEDGMTVVYSKPADFLKLEAVNIQFAKVKIEGNRILSDTAGLGIKYIFRNEDPQSYSRKFIRAFAKLLAADMAFAITNSRSLSESLRAEYEKISLPKAESADAQQGSPIAPTQDEWLGARRTGSSSLVGQTGRDIWYPCCC